MCRFTQRILYFGLIFLVWAPVSVITTWLLNPVWSWLEATFDIESIGHSGPAAWCYIVTYFVSVIIFVLGLWMIKARTKRANTNKNHP